MPATAVETTWNKEGAEAMQISQPCPVCQKPKPELFVVPVPEDLACFDCAPAADKFVSVFFEKTASVEVTTAGGALCKAL